MQIWHLHDMGEYVRVCVCECMCACADVSECFCVLPCFKFVTEFLCVPSLFPHDYRFHQKLYVTLLNVHYLWGV